MVSEHSFIPRLLSLAIRTALRDTPVVCLLGPRKSGKTTLVKYLAPKRPFISLERHRYYVAAREDIFSFKDRRILAVPLKELWER